MSQVKEKPSIVVVDASQEYLSLFASDDAKDLIRFLTAHDRAAAQLVIADKKNFIAGIIVSSNSCDPFGVPLIRFAKQHRLSLIHI